MFIHNTYTDVCMHVSMLRPPAWLHPASARAWAS